MPRAPSLFHLLRKLVKNEKGVIFTNRQWFLICLGSLCEVVCTERHGRVRLSSRGVAEKKLLSSTEKILADYHSEFFPG